jgi:hypothetical protein
VPDLNPSQLQDRQHRMSAGTAIKCDAGMIFEYKNSKPTYTDKEQP